ncbi:MAG: glycogen/starch synthase [Opitutaceae bacterium]|jgi:hypothetical protein
MNSPTRSEAESLSQLTSLIESASFFKIVWETPHTPCTGITAVIAQLLEPFSNLGVVIAPWHGQMKEAKNAITDGKVARTGIIFDVPAGVRMIEAKVLLAARQGRMPIIYVEADGFFLGHPYPPAPELKKDSVFFALALAQLFVRLGGVRKDQWFWGADWESAPSLLLMKSRHHVALHLHNTYDEYLWPEMEAFNYPARAAFQCASALQVGLREADVVATVNRGYAWSLQNELIHTRVQAAHLQSLLPRVVPVENANFSRLSPELKTLASDLANSAKALEALAAFKTAARAGLPAEIRERAAGKTLMVVMGRRVTQKLPEIVVESVRQALKEDPRLFVVFATTPAGDAASDIRLEQIAVLVRESPSHTYYTDGRIPFYDALMLAADYAVMWSLSEPHGGCMQGPVVPIVRSIDGLAAQCPALEPTGIASGLNARWHGKKRPAGLAAREEPQLTEQQTVEDLEEIIRSAPNADNATTRAMVATLKQTLLKAVVIHQTQPAVFAELTREVLQIQLRRSWEINYGGMFSHIAAAAVRRPIIEG